MARIFPGAKVPNRRPMPNAHTCSGYPRWNTYAKLDCMPTSYDGSGFLVKRGDAVQGHKNKNLTPCTKKNGRGKKKRLAPENLCHRYRKTVHTHAAYCERVFGDVRKLIVELSRQPGDMVTRARIKEKLAQLREYNANNLVTELIRLGAARGLQEIVK